LAGTWPHQGAAPGLFRTRPGDNFPPNNQLGE
jgi:hypothetical protein